MWKLVPILSSIFWLLSCDISWGVYSPPLGIPDPTTSWGGTQDPIDDSPPARPDPWTSEVAGYYYINNDTGTDSGRTYGTPATPRATIPTLSAGAYVEVHGTYDVSSGGSNRINGTGTSAAFSANTSGPIWVVGVDGDKPTFTTYKVLITGAYIYLYNVNVTQPTSGNAIQIGSGSAGYPASHIVVRNCDVTGSASPGNSGLLTVAGSSANPVDNVIFYNNLAHDTGPTEDADMDAQPAATGSYVSNFWFLNNTLYNSSGSGLQISAAAPAATFGYIGANTVYNTRQAGLWVKYGTDIIFSENIIYDVQDRCVGGGTSPSKGLGGQYQPTRVWWINNTVYNVRYGIYVPSTTTGYGIVYAIGNKIYNVKDMGGACFAGTPTGNSPFQPAAIMYYGGLDKQKWAVNNTIDNVSSGLHDAATGTGSYFYNNIISNVYHDNGYMLYTETTNRTTTDYNLYYNATAGNMIRWGSVGTKYADLATFQAAVAQEQNSVEADPVYTNQPANDYSLQVTSPTIDNGVVSTVYQTFYDLYGISIQKDIDNTVRPQTAVWDIGAYEYGSGPVDDNTAPTVPTNLAVASTTTVSANLTWTASTDAVGVVGYRIIRDGADAGTSATNSYTDTGLVGGTTYSWTVQAYDAVSNFSGSSDAAEGTTQPYPRFRGSSMSGGWR